MHLLGTPKTGERKSAAAAAVAVLVASLTAAGGTAIAAAVQLPAPSIAQVHVSTNATADYVKQLRAEFGLQFDQQHVTQVANDPSATTDLLGIPLLPNESAEITRRSKLGLSIDTISKALTPLGIYGGAWIDNQHEGQLVVALTTPPTTAIEATISSLTQGQPTRFVQVNTTEKKLNEVIHAVSYSPEYRSMKVQSAKVHLQTSTIDVTLALEAPNDAEAVLTSTFGPTLRITRSADKNVAAVSRDFNSGPLYGGGIISGSNAFCTDGYSNVRDSVGRYYTITAGHCFAYAENVYQGQSSPRFIGQASSTTVYNGATTNCDCEVVGEIPSGTGTESVYVDNNALYRFTQSGTAGVGTPACQAGAVSYTNTGHNQCGMVTNPNTTTTIGYSGGSYTLVDGVAADFTVMHGDSGAPVGNGPSILGVISYTNSGGGGGFSKAANVGSSNVYLGF